MAKKSTKPKPDLPFEEAAARIEELISKIEGEQLPLADLLANCEEGHSLISHCENLLSNAQERLEVMLIQDDNTEPSNDKSTSKNSSDDISLL